MKNHKINCIPGHSSRVRFTPIFHVQLVLCILEKEIFFWLTCYFSKHWWYLSATKSPFLKHYFDSNSTQSRKFPVSIKPPVGELMQKDPIAQSEFVAEKGIYLFKVFLKLGVT